MMRCCMESVSGGMERLKWQVLRAFGVLPGHSAAREMSDVDYVWCGLQMLLDAQMRGMSREEAGGNPGFDWEKFERLGGEGR